MGQRFAACCTDAHMDSNDLHIYFHHDLYCGFPCSPMGHDWRVISTKSSWNSWWDDHVHGSRLCLHCSKNISVFESQFGAPWHVHLIRVHLVPRYEYSSIFHLKITSLNSDF